MGCLLKQGGGLYPRLRVGAVLLAAGEGRRMGGVAKPLIRLAGVPLVNRMLIALSGAGVDEVAVVTGYCHESVEARVRDFPVTLVHHPDYAAGQQGSVRAGLAALNGPFDAIFIVPADQPLIGSADLVELIGAFKRRPGGHALVPMAGGRRGNPVLLDDTARERILAGSANAGCRQFIERHPDLVHAYATDNEHFVVDLDTLDDVRLLEQRTGWAFVLPEPESGARSAPAPACVAAIAPAASQHPPLPASAAARTGG
ncbi:hypothetical protein GCM10023144_26710 [Pigmentiphaga soli]|uniref:MobA-like NTP transferase domain-containing protein n=1 Tax=Pigmentiphaga soli TaxID=1007095 RepID=A0ABP8H4Z8_9BURK